MAVTIRDVAQRAGVSVATVSRVLNASGPVGVETRRRVKEAASELRYAPNSAARSLIKRRTGVLGAVLPDLYGEFFSEVIRGIDQTAQAQGYHLLLSSAHNSERSIDAALRSMRGGVDGLILMSPEADAGALARTLPVGLPVVLLNCQVEDDAFDSLTIDNYGGAYEMVRHLLSHGHRRIAHIAGAAGNRDARERRRGYRAAMRECGGEWSEDLEVAGGFTESGGHRAVGEILALDPRPTAVFAANDSMAIGALSALRESGVRVPGGVAVAGFDDIPIARYVTPALSSVHVPISELGARACGRLLEAIGAKNENERRRETLPTTLVVRGSCGCRGREE